MVVVNRLGSIKAPKKLPAVFAQAPARSDDN